VDKAWLADEKGLREVEVGARSPKGATLLYLKGGETTMAGLYAKERKGAYRVHRVSVHSNDEFTPRVFVVTSEQENDVVSCNKNIAMAVADVLNAVLGYEREGAEKIVEQLVWDCFGG